MQCFVSAPLRAVQVGAQRPRLCVKRARRSTVSVTPRMSLLPLIPNWAVLGAWIYGGYRFFKGYKTTDYQSTFRIPLALAWPVFILVNGRFRENFMRAIRSAGD